MINYKVIATGSKGNAVVINKEILIDCGVPFKALRDYYTDLRLVLLSHIHTDHFNRSTIKRLSSERPTLRWGAPEWLVTPLLECGVSKRNIDVFGINLEHSYRLHHAQVLIIQPVRLVHNAENCGYIISCSQFGKIFYATDTNSLDGINAPNFDLYMVEANYSEAEITERIRQKQEAGEYCHEWDVLKNHLSKEKADDWLYKNMRPNSRYVYLHRHE